MMSASQGEGPTPARRILAGALAALAGATLALLLVSLVLPARAFFALHWYLVGCAAIVSVAAIRLLMRRYVVLWQPNRELQPPEAPPPPDLPARLRTITASVSRAGWDAAGFDHELRPILRAIARQRLAAQGMGGLMAERALLGERGWALLASGDRPATPGAPGVTVDELREIVERLEQEYAGADD